MEKNINFQVIPLEEVPQKDTKLPADRPLVLIVDDEPLVTDTLATILTRAGFRTLKSYNAQDALALAIQYKPALLISDVAMPDMNGVELALALLDTNPCTKILLFSGHATSTDLVTALDAGYDFKLLAKPVHPTDMLLHVSRALNVPERHVPPARLISNVVSMRRTA